MPKIYNIMRYQQNNNRPRFGGFAQQRRPQRGFSRPAFRGERFDNSQFICKAEDYVKIEEVETKHSFEDFGLEAQLLANVMAKGYQKPTLIQDEAIPAVLENKDVLGIAETGTGKTAAFAIPLIQKILKNPGERMIILAPTRELAQQIKEEIRSFTPGLKVYLTLATGGAYLREQVEKIRRGPHIIIGTPGRIKDLGQRRVINFGGMKTVVLDEVDRMLDMGFVEDMKWIVGQTPTDRQTLFFSATVGKKIEPLVNSFLNNPVKISLRSRGASTHVEQNIVRARRAEKEDVLYQLVVKEEFKKVLVFGGTKMMVERVSQTLRQKGVSANSIHGDKRQYDRHKVLQSFRDNQIKVLVATDVAARGLDIADITHVINFDRPNNYEDYIHRIGRTGRGNAKGYALTFVE